LFGGATSACILGKLGKVGFELVDFGDDLVGEEFVEVGYFPGVGCELFDLLEEGLIDFVLLCCILVGFERLFEVADFAIELLYFILGVLGIALQVGILNLQLYDLFLLGEEDVVIPLIFSGDHQLPC
jgi:hypothetical protein